MTDPYVPQEIEPKWQQRWEADGIYRAVVDPDRPKFYYLTMLPYPSGDLHIGHWYAMTPSDAQARYYRMRGYNVLFPMGFDAFGLPAENAAIKHGIHPREWTYANIERMRRQLRSMGAMFDWEREAITCDPEYYRWNQWFFLKFYERGLAYRARAAVDFCPSCNTTLAREQVWGEERVCERCGTPVVKKDLEQWFFKITAYAEELLDFSQIEWPERVVTMQRNWIGRSEGADVVFRSEAGDEIEVFTTRPDTLWGATFMVLAPEHPLVEKLTTPEYREAVEAYQYQAARQSEIQRLALDKEKTGQFIGAYAINPVNEARIPIWIADYVLMTYGTGAIMAVPAHDERDFEFALKFGLPVIPVIAPPSGQAKSVLRAGSYRDGLVEALRKAGFAFEEADGDLQVTLDEADRERYIALVQPSLKPGTWTEVVGAGWAFVFADGPVMNVGSLEEERQVLERCKALDPTVQAKRTVAELLWDRTFYRDLLFHDAYERMINSGPLTGTPGDEAVRRTIAWLEERGVGKAAVNYRLRDWLISRQRYWGTPIPIVYCPECGTVPVPEEDLPVLLPEDVDWKPTGENPLLYHEAFLHTTCPRCGGPAHRETDTMDTFVDSSWYQYRYLSPDYDEGPWDPEEGAYWLPVDQYTGGIEHATMHLLYTRFFTKVLRDLGLVDFDEPMLRLYNQGTVLGEDGEKMSKSRGNVVAPDDLVEQYGADTVRAYLMFFARWDQGGPWDSQGIKGPRRFLEDVWRLVLEPIDPAQAEATPTEEQVRVLRRKTHQTIKRCTEDMEAFAFNTYVAALMEFRNVLLEAKRTPVAGSEAWEEAIETLLLLMAPITPHIAEELWVRTGRPYSIHQQRWPTWDEAIAAEETFTLVIQVNGKVRDRVEVPVDISEEKAREIALASEAVRRRLNGREPKRVIYVPGRLVNVVV
ncbi:MAG: leucine--tRNA ligase [Chloroflexi bacterium]|nr:MAG: leucine--tRNA ligase [Chloroflexota bacterium]